MNSFYVLPTKDRSDARDDYIICINSSVKKRLRLGKFAVVEYYHPNIGRKLKAPCRVAVDETLHDNQIRIDQTLRNAIGIPFNYDRNKTTVEIYPLHLSWFQRLLDIISYILGRRYLFFRVCKADIPDMEKNLCRIPLDAFKLLGCEVGDKVVCESIVLEGNSHKLKVHGIKAYESSDEMIKRREKLEEANASARYPSAEKLLNVSPDIPRIFLDAHIREILQVDSLDPIRVRRDLSDLFFKQVREFGIIFLLSVLAAAQILPDEIRQQVLIPMVMASLALAVFLILINIRAKIK